jgi:hypothetical protein
LVAGLSDTFASDHDSKEGWEERKRAYIERLRADSEDMLPISAADKLYNAKSILDDYREIGPQVWVRFNRGARQQLWYFNELNAVFQQHLSCRCMREFDRVLASLTAEVAAREPAAILA